jgi:hypothetical protein
MSEKDAIFRQNYKAKGPAAGQEKFAGFHPQKTCLYTVFSATFLPQNNPFSKE